MKLKYVIFQLIHLFSLYPFSFEICSYIITIYCIFLKQIFDLFILSFQKWNGLLIQVNANPVILIKN